MKHNFILYFGFYDFIFYNTFISLVGLCTFCFKSLFDLLMFMMNFVMFTYWSNESFKEIFFYNILIGTNRLTVSILKSVKNMEYYLILDVYTNG